MSREIKNDPPRPLWRTILWGAFAVFAVATVTTALGVAFDSSLRGFGAILGAFASVTTIGGVAIAILIYVIQARESAQVSDSLKEFIRENLDAAAASRSIEPEPQDRSIESRPELSGRDILWVDDNPGNNVFEAKALRAAGARIRFVLSTSEAKAAMLSSAFDLVISDMDRLGNQRAGYEILEFIKRHFEETPVIIYSGTAQPEQVSSAVVAGAFTQVADPWSLYRQVTAALQAARDSRS